MNKYKEIVVKIIEETNVMFFRLATFLRIIGFILIICFAWLLEVGTIRTLGLLFGLFLMTFPFTLRIFIAKYKTVGALKFTEYQIITKLIDGERIIHEIEKINRFKFTILDYEGEERIRDSFHSSTMMKIRTGTENKLFFNINNKDYNYQIYLKNEFQKIKLLHFLNIIEKQIKNI